MLQFDGGYSVSMCYRTPDGTAGQARSGIWASSQAGLLWFFDRENAEVLVKVLNGCAYNGHRWVYVAPVTDLEFNLWVTGPNGQRWIHSNTQGTTASTRSDTRAFQCSNEGDRGGPGIASLSVEPARLMTAHAGKPAARTILVTVVDDAGSPVGGANYRWSTDRRSGWAHPSHGTTDSQGRFETTWVAGWPGEGVLSLTVEKEGSRLTEELVTESTVPENPPNGALSIWMNNPNNPSTGYSIDLTPLSEPDGTYYAAIGWDGGYTGLQQGGSRYDRQLQFSVWDAPGHGGAELIDRADDVVCRTFGGEGTGVACELNYPWVVGATYRFEVTEEAENGGSAMTLWVTDLAAGSRRYVGTIRFARRANLTSFYMFVEDFVQRAEHCLARKVRSAAIRRPRALIDGAWVALDEMARGRVSKWTEDPWNPGTPGCANLAVREHAAGLELIIGGETASDPNAGLDYTIPKN